MKDDYVSFEVAKLLKEKGFNEYCLKNYWSSDKELHDWKWELSYNRNSDGNCNTKDCAAPTLQMAMKWLREVHRIDIIIEISDPSVKDRKYYCMIWDGNNNSYILDLFNTYEEAVEAALEYTLKNLI